MWSETSTAKYKLHRVVLWILQKPASRPRWQLHRKPYLLEPNDIGVVEHPVIAYLALHIAVHLRVHAREARVRAPNA